ncbi:MAG: hypothetical protein ACAH80_15560 [Alphaproteobacteria bacterium]
MKNKPLVIVIVLMLALLAVFGVIYYKKHSAKQTSVEQTTTSASSTSSKPQVPVTSSTPAYAPPAAAANDLSAAPVFYLQAHMKGLQRGITSALNRQKIKLADLDKLYFGGGEAPDPNYAVFNPNGLIAFKPAGGKWFGQDLVDKIAKVKGTKLVYNLRRSTDSRGKITDVLYAIIPNVDAAHCGVQAGNEQYATTSQFKIAPDNDTIIEDTAEIPIMQIGCLMDNTHKISWVYRLKLRTQVGSGKAWGSY